MAPLLRSQFPSHASPRTKIHLGILSTAMVDALGGPAEFKQRHSFPLVTSMIPNRNFSLPPGVWTDDTSMTLCLARSLATYTPPPLEGQPRKVGGFDETHQLEAYLDWHGKGVLSAVDHCFDIGNTIQRALFTYSSEPDPTKALERIKKELQGEYCAGNGSLMRVLPVGLAWWRDEEASKTYARRSSATTHPNELCMEICEMWTAMISRVMRNSVEEQDPKYSKLDLLRFIASFPYRHRLLQAALTIPAAVNSLPSDSTPEDLETHWTEHHPLLHLIHRTQIANGKPPPILPTQSDLSSSGYVLHSAVAALYCFFATETFEDGAIMAVNLGGDADTVGAIYAGLAGVWYGVEKGKDKRGAFWSERVEKWKSDLVKRELVEQVAEELAQFSARLENENV